MDKTSEQLVFKLMLSDAPDSLLRVLDLFALQGAQFVALAMRRTEQGVCLRVEVEDLPEDRMRRLFGRLSSSMSVASVD